MNGVYNCSLDRAAVSIEAAALPAVCCDLPRFAFELRVFLCVAATSSLPLAFPPLAPEVTRTKRRRQRKQLRHRGARTTTRKRRLARAR